MRYVLTALLCSVLFSACGEADKPRSRVRLATTTSTDNSGLLRELLPPFEKKENIEVQVIAVGTGKALELGRRGDADILLVHARKREDQFVANGYGIDRHDVMWNDFVIAGPPSDPAGVRGKKDVVEALRLVKAGKHTFVSRGDDSGTHTRERMLWERAGGVPRGESFYLEAGQGMGNCLTIAGEKQAYLLTDRGTYIAYRRKEVPLEVLVEGDPALRNPYGVILVNPEKHPHLKAAEARKLLEYFVSQECQKRIAEFRIDDQILFHPAASG
jgi:tungstate transport system substrate-binding protein